MIRCGAQATSYPGRFVRLELGSNPPETCKAEIYTIPDDKNQTYFGPRGIDIDREGVAWAALSGSGGFASFDRRKCKVFNGPSVVEGKQCPEGWTFYPLDKGPKMTGLANINADFHYYNWTDQFNTSGFGDNTPIANGSGSDSILILNKKTGALDAAARAVPARVLHARSRRPHRRSGRRLEGPRPVGELRHQLPVAHRGWEGHDQQDGQVPGGLTAGS